MGRVRFESYFSATELEPIPNGNPALVNRAFKSLIFCSLSLPCANLYLFCKSEIYLHVKMAKNGVAVGIDLGTTYSCVGVWQHDRVEIIANDQGNRTTPSSVAFTDSERFIGDAAKNQAALNSVNTVFG